MIGRWAYLHHRSILLALVLLAVGGVFSAFGVPVGLFPHVDFPRIVVNVDAGDRPAERMGIEVTWPLEEAVRAVPGVRSVRSTTTRGSADISVNFDWSTDTLLAMLQVESAINQIRSSLPPATSFEVRRMDPTVFPVLGYSLVSDTRSLVELRDVALYRLRPALSSITGVSKVGVLGGPSAELQVLVDPARLASFEMTVAEVADALSASNVIQAVGRIESDYKLYLVLSDTQFRDAADVAKTILRSGQQGIVTLEDVAQVEMGTAPQWKRVTADGQDAVLFQIYQQPGGNTVQIAADCKARLQQLQKSIPSGIRISNWYDQSDLIISSALSARDALILGVILAMLTLFVFLGNLRVTFIAAITVPIVLATLSLAISVFGMGYNIMTLGGMAAAVGLIIDDAIVMIEHIVRRIRGSSGEFRNRIIEAAIEFTRPLAGSSASTVIIFAPLAFLSGVTGAFFKALSLTMALGLAISFVVAWLAVPLLSIHLLREKDAEQEDAGPVFRAITRGYGWLLSRSIPVPWMLWLAILPFCFLGYSAYQHIGSGFIPSMDEGGFILDYVAQPGTSLSETDRLLRQVEGILAQTKDVETWSRRTGLSLGGHITEANEGDFFVRLAPQPRRPLDEVMTEVRDRVERLVPGLEIELAKLMEDLIGDLTAVPQPIEIKVFSDDNELLGRLAPIVAERISTVPGVVDVKDGIVLAGDALDVEISRPKAALEGVDPDQVSQTLRSFLTGLVTTQVQRGPKMIGLRVWLPESRRRSVESLSELRLTAPDGHVFPLERIGKVTRVTGQPQIHRFDLEGMVAVTGRISDRDMGSTVKDVIHELDQPGLLPKGVYYTLGGLYEQQRIAFRGLMAVFAGAVALVFLLLLYLYESFRVAAAMMLTALVAIAAVFVGLWLTGTELNITAIMGMTMVIGIVTEVTIFYYSEYVELGSRGSARERIVRAGQNRLRPILMTTIAAFLALLPLALGLGEGAAMLQPLAIAILSGLSVQVFLVLFAFPLFLTMLRALPD